MSEDAPLLEPVPVEHEYCSGLLEIEDLGSNACFVLFINQKLYEAGGQQVRLIKKRIVLPLSAIEPAVTMTLAYLARKAVRAAGDRLLYMVRGSGG